MPLQEGQPVKSNITLKTSTIFNVSSRGERTFRKNDLSEYRPEPTAFPWGKFTQKKSV